MSKATQKTLEYRFKKVGSMKPYPGQSEARLLFRLTSWGRSLVFQIAKKEIWFLERGTALSLPDYTTEYTIKHTQEEEEVWRGWDQFGRMRTWGAWRLPIVKTISFRPAVISGGAKRDSTIFALLENEREDILSPKKYGTKFYFYYKIVRVFGGNLKCRAVARDVRR